MSKKKKPDIPKRGYTWLGYLWISAICVFLAVQTIIDGQYGWGEPQTIIITAEGEPLRFWSAIAGLGAVFVLTISLWIKEEAYYRRLRACFEEEPEADE